jgi:hypothetical protein
VVTHIDRDATRLLPSALFSSHTGGVITAREKNGQWVPSEAIYRVTLTLEHAAPLKAETRGKVIIEAAPREPALAFFSRAAAVLLRESGL